MPFQILTPTAGLKAQPAHGGPDLAILNLGLQGDPGGPAVMPSSMPGHSRSA